MNLRTNTTARHAALGMCLLVVTAACGGDSGSPATASATSSSTTIGSEDPGTTTGGDPGDPSFLDEPANPLPVTFTRAEGDAVTVEVGTDGGTLTTTSADGVGYTLTIPPGAVFGPVEITMTPISLADSPLQAEVLGVALEPDGLMLFEPATLEISGGDLTSETTATFHADRDGGDLYLDLGTVDGTATLLVSSFSTAGAIKAQEAEIQALYRDFRPQDRHRRYSQEMRTIVLRIGPTSVESMSAGLDAVLTEWLADIAAAAPGAAPAELEQLIGAFLRAERMSWQFVQIAPEIQLPGAASGLVTAGSALHAAAHDLFREANLRCIQDRTPSSVFTMYRWALVASWFELKGYTDSSVVDEMENAMKQCMRFTLDFESTAGGASDPVSFSIMLEGEVDLGAGAGVDLEAGEWIAPPILGDLAGSGEVTAPAGTYPCSATEPFGAHLWMGIDVRFGAIADSTWTSAEVGVGFPDPPVDWSCGELNGMQGLLWWPWWQAFQGRGQPVPEVGYDVYVFELSRGGPAEAVYSDSGTFEGVTVTLDITVRHEPQLP